MRVGFIGLGNMGGPMASHIIAAGHEVTVHDLRQKAAQIQLEHGAKWANSPKAIAAASEVTFTSLPGPTEVEAVALGEEGILRGSYPNSVYIDLSTSSPTLIREIHAAYQEQNVHVLDAPVSGGAGGGQGRPQAGQAEPRPPRWQSWSAVTPPSMSESSRSSTRLAIRCPMSAGLAAA